MTAQILDGNALGQKLRAGFKQQADELAAQGVRPGLAVILVHKLLLFKREPPFPNFTENYLVDFFFQNVDVPRYLIQNLKK